MGVVQIPPVLRERSALHFRSHPSRNCSPNRNENGAWVPPPWRGTGGARGSSSPPSLPARAEGPPTPPRGDICSQRTVLTRIRTPPEGLCRPKSPQNPAPLKPEGFFPKRLGWPDIFPPPPLGNCHPPDVVREWGCGKLSLTLDTEN